MPNGPDSYNSSIMKISARHLCARAGCLIALALATSGTALAQDAASQAPEAIAVAAQSYLLDQLAGLPGQPAVSIDPPRAERPATPCPHLCRRV